MSEHIIAQLTDIVGRTGRVLGGDGVVRLKLAGRKIPEADVSLKQHKTLSIRRVNPFVVV